MKKIILFMSLAGAIVLCSGSEVYSQSLIKKLKKKAEEKLIEKAFDEKDESKQQDQDAYYQENDENRHSSISNTRGEGLTNTPPDVKANINDAGKFFDSKEFSKSRHSIRQAIIGIEMEIGENVLKDMPGEINNLAVNTEFDKVTSSSMGFVGLTIERVYQGEGQEFRVTIGNDGLLPSSVNMYQGTAVYETSTEQNQKEVDYKGYKSLLEYDDSEGYTLSVPFGQSSVMVLNGVNFANEQEMLQAANQIDIENIKNQLGEK